MQGNEQLLAERAIGSLPPAFGLDVIGVWKTEAGYTRCDEFPSGGIGPHDLRLMPDSGTLVVANGALPLTLPTAASSTPRRCGRT